MLLRPAQDSDRPAICELDRAAVRASLTGTSATTAQIEAWASRCTPELYHIGRTEFHVACEGPTIGAFAELCIHAGELETLAVAPAFAGRGVGRALLKHIESIALANGLPRLEVVAARGIAGFYERMGYRIANPSIRLPEDDLAIPRVMLSKAIAGPGLKPAWFIRPARPEDCAGICEAHIASIKALCAPHYTPDQVAAWLDGKAPAHYAPLLEQFMWFVAEEDGNVLGFGALDPYQAPGVGEIDGLYLSPAGAGRGIGRALVRRMESIARELGAGTLIVKATTNASPFYAHCGFRETARTTHRTRSGVELPSVAMEKRIARP